MKKSVMVIGIFVILIIISYLVIFQDIFKSGENDEKRTTPNSENDTNTPVNSHEKDNTSNNMLSIACMNAVEDYPDWTKPTTDLIIWEDADKDFNFRTSPEGASTGVDSPAQNSEILIDFDFVGINETSYVKKQGNNWRIGLFKLNGLNPPANSIIYETEDNLDSVDISPINKKQFIVFSVKNNTAYLNKLDTEKLTNENIFQLPSTGSIQKIAVSPGGTFVYFLYDDVLRIFEILPKTKIGEIKFVKSVVWVGDSYLLYSDSEKTYIYDIKNEEKEELEMVDSVSGLSFNPKDKGIIAYNINSKGEVVNCQTWNKLNSMDDVNIETLVSEKTAMIEKDGIKMYWRFRDADWTLVPSQVGITKYAAVWKRY